MTGADVLQVLINREFETKRHGLVQSICRSCLRSSQVVYAACCYLDRALSRALENATDEADSWLSKSIEDTDQLFLLACAAVLIASKMFDVAAISNHALCRMFLLTMSDLNVMERGLLKFLDWNLNIVTPFDFLGVIELLVDETMEEQSEAPSPRRDIWVEAERGCMSLLGSRGHGRSASELAFAATCRAFESSCMDTAPLFEMMLALGVGESGGSWWALVDEMRYQAPVCCWKSSSSTDSHLSDGSDSSATTTEYPGRGDSPEV